MVDVWVQPTPKLDCTLRLRPTVPCELFTEPIDAVQLDAETSERWLDSHHKAALMVRRQAQGRHFRARTVEATEDLLTGCIDDMLFMLGTPRWRADARRMLVAEPSNPYLWPIPATLERSAREAVHFLCLLGGRLADGAIPADVWASVVHLVLPRVRCYGYSNSCFHILGCRPWVELAPLPALPSAPCLKLIASTLLTRQDTLLHEFLVAAWVGERADMCMCTSVEGRELLCSRLVGSVGELTHGTPGDALLSEQLSRVDGDAPLRERLWEGVSPVLGVCADGTVRLGLRMGLQAD